MKEKMTAEQVQAKAKELSDKLGKCVYGILLEISDTDQCIAYVKEPSRQAKIVAIGTLRDGANMASIGMPLLESGLILEESDPRANPMTSGNDDIVISAAFSCAGIMKIYNDGVKKN